MVMLIMLVVFADHIVVLIAIISIVANVILKRFHRLCNNLHCPTQWSWNTPLLMPYQQLEKDCREFLSSVGIAISRIKVVLGFCKTRMIPVIGDILSDLQKQNAPPRIILGSFWCPRAACGCERLPHGIATVPYGYCGDIAAEGYQIQ